MGEGMGGKKGEGGEGEGGAEKNTTMAINDASV